MDQIVPWDSLALKISSSTARVTRSRLLPKAAKDPLRVPRGRVRSSSPGTVPVPGLRLSLAVSYLARSWISKYVSLRASQLPAPRQCW